MNKHTPGPWIATHNSWDFSDVFGPDGKSVALCQISPYVTEDTQKDLEQIKEANARLIAAAPELLEALKNTHELLQGTLPNINREARNIARQQLKANRSLIEKATGETT